MNRRERRAWVRAMRADPRLSDDTKKVAAQLAKLADRDGTITIDEDTEVRLTWPTP